MPGAKGKIWWSYLSLLAALAIVVPSVAWACPMTGRIASTPAQVCPCAAASEAASSNDQHGCCHKIPTPLSDTSGDGKHGAFFSSLAQIVKVKAPAAPQSNPGPGIFDLPSQQHSFAFSARATSLQQSSRLHFTQPFLALHSGRAPPV